MLQIDVGDNSSAAPDIVPVAVSPGQTVVLTNVTNSNGNILYYTNGIDGSATTLTPGNNVSLTAQAWMQASGGVATVTLTGGIYG